MLPQLPQLPPAVAQVADELPPAFMTYDEVAAYLRIKVPTLYQWVREGRVPGPTRLGGSSRFTADWLAAVVSYGTQPKGTYTNPASARAEAGRLGAQARQLGQLDLDADTRRQLRTITMDMEPEEIKAALPPPLAEAFEQGREEMRQELEAGRTKKPAAKKPAAKKPAAKKPAAKKPAAKKKKAGG